MTNSVITACFGGFFVKFQFLTLRQIFSSGTFKHSTDSVSELIFTHVGIHVIREWGFASIRFVWPLELILQIWRSVNLVSNQIMWSRIETFELLGNRIFSAFNILAFVAVSSLLKTMDFAKRALLWQWAYSFSLLLVFSILEAHLVARIPVSTLPEVKLIRVKVLWILASSFILWGHLDWYFSRKQRPWVVNGVYTLPHCICSLFLILEKLIHYGSLSFNSVYDFFLFFLIWFVNHFF